MPRKEINDYTIYKIVCLDEDLDLCYVGSTANWKQRHLEHKFNTINENSKKHNRKLYQTIRENGGWDNFKMIQLGTREQIKKREAEAIEEEYRKELRANMNSKRCFTTEEQDKELKREYDKKYQQENKDKINQQRKEYRQENKVKIAEQDKKYREENKVKIAERDKKYREENKDKIIQVKNQYYEKNKVKINQQRNVKVECECGCMVNHAGLARHRKTPKHLKLINAN